MPGGRPREFDPDEALDAAVEVFREFGFAGTSMSALTEAMGVNRPSLYAAFGDKDMLFEAAVERYVAQMGEAFAKIQTTPKVRDAFGTLFAELAVSFTRPGRAKGCLLWTCWACFGPSGPRPDSALARAERSVRQAFRRRLEMAREENQLSPHEDLDALTCFYMVQLQGLSTLARGGRPRESLLSTARFAVRALPLEPATSAPPTRPARGPGSVHS